MNLPQIYMGPIFGMDGWEICSYVTKLEVTIGERTMLHMRFTPLLNYQQKNLEILNNIKNHRFGRCGGYN